MSYDEDYTSENKKEVLKRGFLNGIGKTISEGAFFVQHEPRIIQGVQEDLKSTGYMLSRSAAGGKK
ncbi:hypothetical protein SAMN06296241_2908 [Salinimicrobium sediminis]|uniref:Uncharacterized protein n=1 Tax=Salinimicrobium sediminis TaxID=1343891 RepID=A0A285X7M4_9FLAO|nr:hypothetical protein SAMN06296241_2908 [Salinimicrobium sediminis]